MHDLPIVPPPMGPEHYDFELPPELIAQRPAPSRGEARLLWVQEGGVLEERRASELASVLPADALVVLNDSSVVPARVFATRDDGRVFELLMCEVAPELTDGDCVRAWVRHARRLRLGDRLRTGEIELVFEGEDAVDARARRFRIRGGNLLSMLERAGQVPLPPYIARPDGPDADDRARYQTLFAERPGSVAAPTAGLHFESALLASLDVAKITLHVGPGTFLPMEAADVREHRVGPERYFVAASQAEKIEAARAQGRPIIAVGTTATRTLEGIAALNAGVVRAGEGWIDLMITPGHNWQVVDGLLTNFHLPRSSLLMLVSTLGGHERVMAAYARAVERRFRFFSYGDCMFVRRELK
jgi:S-adenosylmethionine:tRNA ribosyltransferase-isomerase